MRFLVEKQWTKQVNKEIAKRFRKALHGNDYIELEKAFRALLDDISRLDHGFKGTKEDILEELEMLGPVTDYQTVEEYEDGFNYILSMMYDFCDENDIWIGTENF